MTDEGEEETKSQEIICGNHVSSSRSRVPTASSSCGFNLQHPVLITHFRRESLLSKALRSEQSHLILAFESTTPLILSAYASLISNCNASLIPYFVISCL